MDARKYDPIKQVSATVFTAPQRQRLEAFTAASQLLPHRGTLEQLAVADFIATGTAPVVVSE